MIDTSATCVLGEVNAIALAGKATLTWAPVVHAVNYEVRVFGVDGHFISAAETRSTQMQIDAAENGAVLSVRPECGTGLGEAVYRMVAAD